MATEPRYRPFDQDEKLGSPPWSSTDPKLVAWERAHGHDVRVKCCPELGCVLVEESLRDQVQQLRGLVEQMLPLVNHSDSAGCPMAFHRSDGEQCTCGALNVAREARAALAREDGA